jgi:LmbE family N-acetylglucosaminyl deacetylase
VRSAWHERLERLPRTPPADPGGRVLVLSAHPDDEVLAIGGWLAAHADRDVVFVTATDGEASHPDSPTTSGDDLRARRPGELVDALRALGFEHPDVRRLLLPDGGLAGSAEALDAALAPLVAAADLVLAPFELDGHPDHDAVGAAAVRLCGDRTRLWRFPVWTWAWTEPDGQPWEPQLRRLDSSAEHRDRKRRAIDAFVTQVQPLGDHPADAAVVGGTLLRHALHAPEVVVA